MPDGAIMGRIVPGGVIMVPYSAYLWGPYGRIYWCKLEKDLVL